MNSIRDLNPDENDLSYTEQLLDFITFYPNNYYELLFYLAISIFFIIALFPFYWLVIVSLTPLSEVTNISYLPAGFNPRVFIKVFGQVPIHHFIFNSIVIASATTIIVITIGSLAGYAFGRYDLPGKLPLMLGFLIITYFPGTTYLIPLFRIFTGNVTVLGVSTPDLFNTPVPIILPLSGITMPLAVFILTTFYSQIPESLEDAARIEGCTRIGALYHVIMPLSAPGLITAGMITFITAYNDFFFSFLMVDGSPNHFAPLVHGIYDYQTLTTTPYNLMAAASILGLIPVIVIVIFGQKRIVSGLTSGGLKQ